MRFPGLLRSAAAVFLLPLLAAPPAFAWGHDAHALIDRLALAGQPEDVPAFLKTPAALDAIAFYAPEPDHWRVKSEPFIYVADSPEHFIDLEWADLISEYHDTDPHPLPNGSFGPFPRDRWDFVAHMRTVLQKHPEIDIPAPSIGILPYKIAEDYERLRNTMRTYRSLVAKKQDTRPVEAEIIFLAGILGHFVGDGSQPLHCTIQYNGWTGPNPHGYTTEHTIHSRFEGDFIHFNLDQFKVAPLVNSKPAVIDDVFADAMAYIRQSNAQVEKTYQLDKTGAFTGKGTPEGYVFVDQRLAAGTTKLRDIIYTAWVRSNDHLTNPY